MAKSTSAGAVVARAQTALDNSPIYALRQLRVDSNDSGLQISGSVDSFYHKQLAQEAVRAVAGELVLVNAVDVAYRPSLIS